MSRCSKCVTPGTYPRMDFNDQGVCNYCIDYENKYSDWGMSKKTRENNFQKLINSAKKKDRKYDVLVPLSGGKDSTYVLYLATKKYKCKTLCYTFDNGFQSDIAKKNIKSAIEASGADLMTFQPNNNLLMKLYKHFLEHTGFFCPVCMRGIYVGSFKICRLFDIPLVLKGTSRRTEENLVPEIFQDGSLAFFKNVLKKHPFDENINSFYTDRSIKEKISRALYLLTGGRVAMGTIDVSVPDYFDWNYDEMYATIKSEMGWEALPDRDEHVDCLADPAVHYLRQLRFSDLTPNTLRYSSEIRSGQRKRSEALELIKEEKNIGIKDEHLNYFLTKLNISYDDLIEFSKDPFKHMEFQKDPLMNLFHNTRKMMAKSVHD